MFSFISEIEEFRGALRSIKTDIEDLHKKIQEYEVNNKKILKVVQKAFLQISDSINNLKKEKMIIDA